jgi:hypothetical protein
MGRRDGRDELCRVAARTTGVTRRASPSDLPGAPRGPCGETRAHDVRGFARRRIAAAAQQRTCRAHDARSCARTRLTASSAPSTQRRRPCACWRDASERGVECSEHATLKAMRAAARRERARSHRPCWSSITSPRMRPAGPRGVASTRTSRSRTNATIATAVFATRSTRTSIMGRREDRGGRLTRSTRTSIMGRREDRDELCRVAARTTGVTRRASPSDLPGAPRGPCGETRAHDVRGFARRRIAAAAQQMTCRAHDARSCARTRLTASSAPSTQRRRPCACWRDASERGVECSEHATLKAMRAAARRERARSRSTSTLLVVHHVSANAPGRTEGSREHTDLTVTDRRDDRHGRLRHTVDAHLDHGQTRRPPQPSSPHGRRAPRSWADARTAAAVFATRSTRTPIMGRREDRDELCRVAARTTGITRRASPWTCRALRHERARRRMLRARDAEGHARGCATRASTVAEHIDPASRRSRLRECARQDRGESRAHGPHGHGQTRRSPRPSSPHGRRAPRSWAVATAAAAVFATRSTHTSIMADATARRALSRGGANHRRHASGLSFGPAGRSAWSMRRDTSTRCSRICTKTHRGSCTAEDVSSTRCSKLRTNAPHGVECSEHATPKAVRVLA